MRSSFRDLPAGAFIAKCRPQVCLLRSLPISSGVILRRFTHFTLLPETLDSCQETPMAGLYHGIWHQSDQWLCGKPMTALSWESLHGAMIVLSRWFPSSMTVQSQAADSYNIDTGEITSSLFGDPAWATRSSWRRRCR